MVMGKLDEAYGELIASAADFDRLEDRRNRARALNRAAYVARMQRRYPEATALVETAAALVEPGDAEEAYGDFVAATLALDAEDWTRAMAGFNKSLARLGAFGRHDDDRSQPDEPGHRPARRRPGRRGRGLLRTSHRADGARG